MPLKPKWSRRCAEDAENSVRFRGEAPLWLRVAERLEESRRPRVAYWRGTKGLSSNGRTPGWHPGDRGSSPHGSTTRAGRSVADRLLDSQEIEGSSPSQRTGQWRKEARLLYKRRVAGSSPAWPTEWARSVEGTRLDRTQEIASPSLAESTKRGRSSKGEPSVCTRQMRVRFPSTPPGRRSSVEECLLVL